MHSEHQIFVQAIHFKSKLKLTFFSKEDGVPLVRTCAPMDFGPSRRAKDTSNRYHFWDYDSDTKSHTLSLLPEQVIQIKATEDSFNPVEFIIWDTKKSPWFLPRDWGTFS
ncbi:hypothetical protein PI95_003685 [Hassallia byssoidea VB512170]|uniref:Uncharacterized protein n=1 Tax=Hassallia byssoidea VB512170 TaxID=1304833 RepID=A0A846H3W7_9CYAN|nr:hypothetical protein [Hassalia byssoidea]NEU71708.1 hypothetical protein [Hassalia byssoidea VB512170]